jgi:hypothetical protein
VTVTDDFEARYWLRDQRLPDPDDVPIFNYFEQVDRVNVLVASGKWNAKLQVDEVLLGANRYYLDDVLYVERPAARARRVHAVPRGRRSVRQPREGAGHDRAEVGARPRWATRTSRSAAASA